LSLNLFIDRRGITKLVATPASSPLSLITKIWRNAPKRLCSIRFLLPISWRWVATSFSGAAHLAGADHRFSGALRRDSPYGLIATASTTLREILIVLGDV